MTHNFPSNLQVSADGTVPVGPDGLIRPANPTLAQLRAVCQPPHVRARKNAEHWTAELYLRHISIYFTRVLVKTRITANQVTTLMMITGWFMGAAMLIPGIWGPLIAVVLSQVQLYLDCCDGEVARWRGVRGPKGIFIDMVAHHSTEAAVAVGVGVRVAMGVSPGAFTADGWAAAWAGATLGVLLLMNRSQSIMMHASRAFAGVEKLPDTSEARAMPPASLIGRLRSMARFVPFHRMLHAVELSLIFFAASIVSAVIGQPVVAESWVIWVLLVATVGVNVGHFCAQVFSARLAPLSTGWEYKRPEDVQAQPVELTGATDASVRTSGEN